MADGGDTEGTVDVSGGVGEQPMDAETAGDRDDDDMNELMHNRDFLRSVLSSLPGVNPEEALQNLEEMAEQQERGKSEKEKEEVSIIEVQRGLRPWASDSEIGHRVGVDV